MQMIWIRQFIVFQVIYKEKKRKEKKRKKQTIFNKKKDTNNIKESWKSKQQE